MQKPIRRILTKDLPTRRVAILRVRAEPEERRIGNGSHPEIELQIELYGWLYEQTFGEPPVALQIHNGLGEILVLPYEGGRRALEVLEEILRIRLSAEEPATPVAGGSARAAASSSAAGPRPSSGARPVCSPGSTAG
jgi:hypothetical protein